MNIQKSHIAIGSAVGVLVLTVIILVATSDHRRYGEAVAVYRAGRLAEALSIVNELSPQYQAKATATYLKADCHLQLAQREAASGNHEAALAHLKQIPQTFQKYGDVAKLILASSHEVERLAAEAEHRRATERQRETEAARVAQAAPRPVVRERYYRDSKGAIISESEGESQLQQIRSNIRGMPDNLERAYYEGMLQAVEKEWERVKQQGPISQ